MKSRAILLCALGLASALAAAADSFPPRPVTLIVPFPPGGPSDALARLGQQMIVENLAGAVGGIGTKRVERAKPGG